ncbi:MAG: hypothetical protein ABIJ08_01330 [Nanoarchaeota archaeon]
MTNEEIQNMIQVSRNDTRSIDDYSTLLGADQFLGTNILDFLVHSVLKNQAPVHVLDPMCGTAYAWVTFFERLERRYSEDATLVETFPNYLDFEEMFKITAVDIRSIESIRRGLSVRRDMLGKNTGNLPAALKGLDLFSNKIGFHKADISEYIPDRSYDAIFSVAGLLYVQDIFRTVERLFSSALADNGVLLMSGFDPHYIIEQISGDRRFMDMDNFSSDTTFRGNIVNYGMFYNLSDKECMHVLFIQKRTSELDFGFQLIESKMHPLLGHYYRVYKHV